MSTQQKVETFPNLDVLSKELRNKLDNKDYILIFAHNGTGKTQLTQAFKNESIKNTGTRDTLYFNAYTEDLFSWENENSRIRLESESILIKDYIESGGEPESDINHFLERFSDFEFKIIPEGGNYYIFFDREVNIDGRSKKEEDIKISRGEENIFIWSFFLAILQKVIDSKLENSDNAYSKVNYIYIDDPVSSLDESNVVCVACQLAAFITNLDVANMNLKFIVSTHHPLFFNTFKNEIHINIKEPNKKISESNKGKSKKDQRSKKQYCCFYFSKIEDGVLQLHEESKDVPWAYHISVLQELIFAKNSSKVQYYHFNLLRSLLEKTAGYFGYRSFDQCFNKESETRKLDSRFLNTYSHGKDSSLQFSEPPEEHKEKFKEILEAFINKYEFNIPETVQENPNRADS